MMIKKQTVHQTILKISNIRISIHEWGMWILWYIHYQFLFNLKLNQIELIKSKHIFEKLTQEY